MLELTDIDIKQTRFYQDVSVEVHLALIRRLLQRRCGEVPPMLAAQIDQLAASQLEALSEALLDFRDIADLEQWLVSHGTRPLD